MTGSLAADESGGAERRVQSPAIDAGVFQQAVACANHGVILVSAVSPDMPIVYANDAFLGMTGYTLPEVVGRNCRFLQGSDLAQPEIAALRSAIDARQPIQVILRNYRRDGTLFWNELQISPLTTDGETTHFVGIQSDVTRRVNAEQALRSSEDRFRALTENGLDMISILNDDLSIVYSSPSVARVLGYPAADRVGENGTGLIHPDDLPRILRAVSSVQAGATRTTDRIIARRRHHNGNWRHIEMLISNENDNPAIQGIVCTSRDITDRIVMQEQLVQTGKLAALGELMAGVAHEINNPLAAISGQAQLLARHADTEVQQEAKSISSMVQRASRIVRSLRTYARPSGGETQRSLRDLNDIVHSSLEVIGYRLRRAEIEVELKLADDLPAVSVSGSEIEQVLVNLLSNAEQAVKDTGQGDHRITVETRAVSASRTSSLSGVALIVTDNGSGIDTDILPRIFDPFFTTKDVGAGTGLGLYISHGIITAHGGSITADSRPGEGATFTIELPAA
jgi:PAS domain S-box-containing protein